MTIIYGTDEIDHSGSCLAVGDIDGDGRDDIIIGSGALGTLRNVYDRGGAVMDRPTAGWMLEKFGLSSEKVISRFILI
jgi:hypothetical protein